MATLEETYPALGDKIGAAREAGYSDEDIHKHIRGKIQTATKAGYSTEEVGKYLGEIPKPSIMEPIKGTAKGVAETTVGIAPAIVGGLVAGPLGAAAGAGGGETLRQMIFDDEINPWTIAWAAGTGWIPGLGLESKVAGQVAKIGIKAAETGAFGGLLGEGRKVIEKGKEYKFDPEETIYNTLAGAAFGTLFGALGAKKAAKTEIPPDAEAKLKEVAANLAKIREEKAFTLSEALAMGKAGQQAAATIKAAPAPGVGLQQLDVSPLAGALHTGESVASRLNISLEEIPALVKAGKLVKDAKTGMYQTTAEAQAEAKAQPRQQMTIDDRDFIERYRTGTPEQRTQMERGIRVNSALWNQIQNEKRFTALKDPVDAQREIVRMIEEHGTAEEGPSKQVNQSRLMSLGIDPENMQFLDPAVMQAQIRNAAAALTGKKPPVAETPLPKWAYEKPPAAAAPAEARPRVAAAPPEAQAAPKRMTPDQARQTEINRLQQLVKDESFSPEDRAQFQEQLNRLRQGEQPTPPRPPTEIEGAPPGTAAAVGAGMEEALAKIRPEAPPAPQPVPEAQPAPEVQPRPEPAPAAAVPETAPQIPEIAMTKEAVPKPAGRDPYRDPLDRPMTPQEQADWDHYVRMNRAEQHREIALMKFEKIPALRAQLAQPDVPFGPVIAAPTPPPEAPAAPAPGLLPGKPAIPQAYKQMTEAQLETLLARPDLNPGTKFLAEKELALRQKGISKMSIEELNSVAQDTGANKEARARAAIELEKKLQTTLKAQALTPEERLAQLEAEQQNLKAQLGEFGPAAATEFARQTVDEKVATIKRPRGGTAAAPGSPEAQRDAMARRQQMIDLFRSMHQESQVSGKTMEQVLAQHGVTYGAMDKMWRELLYPMQHFSWENIEPDVVRNRMKERDILRSVYQEARRQNKPAEVIAAQRNLDRDTWKNIVHEVKIDDMLNEVGASIRASDRLNERSKFLTAEIPAIEATGTIRPGSKETFREDVRKATDTYRRKISEIGFDRTRSQIIDSLEGLSKLADQQKSLGSSITAKAAADIQHEATTWVKNFNREADRWMRDRMAWGRIGKAQQRPPIPLDLRDFMVKAGAQLDAWRSAPERVPIDTGLWEAVKNWRNLSPAEKRQAQDNAVNSVRYNLFPITSFTLDAVLNTAEAVTQHLEALPADIAYGLKSGKWTYPNTRAVGLAWKNVTSNVRERIYSPEFEEGVKFTASGEPLPGNLRMRELINLPKTVSDIGSRDYWKNFFQTGKQGAFTYRSTQASAAYDVIKGTPMYAKGAVDSAYKRFAGSMSMFADALKAAGDAGIEPKSLHERQFVKDYWANVPKDSLDRAVDRANAAGFSRELPQFAERISRSRYGQLFMDAFGRFSWQFLRWTGDMLGANPTILKKLGTAVKTNNWSNVSPEEVTRYLVRAAAGWGGIALLDSHFYNRTDFNSMEYVDEEGNRQRLQGREPIASALFLSALVRGMTSSGDERAEAFQKAYGAMRYTSFPLLKSFFGDGGLVSSLSRRGAEAAIAGRYPWKDEQTVLEINDLVNRAIPGQAVFAALKSGIDPTVREGIGGGLPGVSLMKPAKIDLTTGEPLQVTQRAPVGGLSMRAIQGVPIPGFYRELNPAAQMLSRYGLMTYRGVRLPIAGEYPSEAPTENIREWQTEFGRLRGQLLGKLVPIIEQIEARNGAQIVGPRGDTPGSPLFEAIRAKIKSYDAIADQQARAIINARYGTPSKLPRKPTARETRMPSER